MKYLLLFCIFKLVFSKNCDFNQDCYSCQECFYEKDFCECTFHNSFCFNLTKNGYSYNSSFLFKYENNKCFSTINSDDNLYDKVCGKNDFSSEINIKDFINFFSFNKPEILNSKSILCQYTFTNNEKNSKEDLVIEVEVQKEKDNNKQIDDGKNLIIIFVQEFDSLTKTLYEINLNEFKNNTYIVKISNYKYVSLYVSLIQNNDYININEIMALNIGAKKDNSKALKEKKYKYSLIFVSILFILCIISCFILYLIKYRRNRELIRLRAINMANNLNELQNRIDPEEKKNKINELFKKKLKKIKYLKKLNVNETTACSICLEEFIENKSLVCITPCLHIFHYDCIYNWLFSENSNCQCPYCNYDLLSNKEPTKRHKKQEINNATEKNDKNENKSNKKEKIPTKEDNNKIYNTSERIIKKHKKNKDKNNNNDIKNINKNDNNINNNINNKIDNNFENKKENEKDKSPSNENEDNDISFENDFDKIKNNKNIIKNIKQNNENNTSNKEKEIKNEIEINIDDDENKNNINNNIDE